MKRVLVMMGLALAASAGVATADPGKDESGKGRERASSSRELRFDRDEARGREDRGERSRRTTREFKEEYDDGRCKVERKLEKSGEYKEEIKCRPGGRRS
jgi:hypothetical protein